MTTQANPVGRYAVVEDGTVTNVIMWDGNVDAWAPPADAVMVPVPDGVFVEPGYTFGSGKFTGTPAADTVRDELGI